MELMAANREWRTRPADQRFPELDSMIAAKQAVFERSRAAVVPSRQVRVEPKPGDEMNGLVITGPNGAAYEPTNWAFGQLSKLAKAPAGYLRDLPAPLAADCINYGLQVQREVPELGVLLHKPLGAQPAGSDFARLLGQPSVHTVETTPAVTLAPSLRAATGPNYGRIWDLDICRMLRDRFGNGLDGQWRVPGVFGKRVNVTRENTTLFGSDHDMFVFLADEDRRIEIGNRRDGKPGSFARGFYVRNGECGDVGVQCAFFLFDFMCCNRIIWGASQVQEVRIRHTAGAPDRWLDEVVPVLDEFAHASPRPVVEAIESARQRRIDGDVAEWMAGRFGKNIAARALAAHQDEEHRPVATVWDAVTAVTAYARTMPHQDARVILERDAGKLLAA